MAKVTWLGEDTKDIPGPSFNMWGKYKFPKGRAVEVTDEDILSQARTNQFYRVVEQQAKATGTPPPLQLETASAKTPEAKTEAKPAQPEAKAAGKKDPADYPPARKAPKKQVRKLKAAAHAHR